LYGSPAKGLILLGGARDPVLDGTESSPVTYTPHTLHKNHRGEQSNLLLYILPKNDAPPGIHWATGDLSTIGNFGLVLEHGCFTCPSVCDRIDLSGAVLRILHKRIH